MLEKSERLRELRQRLGISQAEFAKIWGTDQSNLSKIEKGDRPIGKRLTNDLIRAFKLNPQWWETGKGEMFLTDILFNDAGLLNDPDFLKDIVDRPGMSTEVSAGLRLFRARMVLINSNSDLSLDNLSHKLSLPIDEIEQFLKDSEFSFFGSDKSISLNLVDALHRELGYNTEWILFGRGPMKVSDKSASSANNPESAGISNLEMEYRLLQEKVKFLERENELLRSLLEHERGKTN